MASLLSGAKQMASISPARAASRQTRSARRTEAPPAALATARRISSRRAVSIGKKHGVAGSSHVRASAIDATS